MFLPEDLQFRITRLASLFLHLFKAFSVRFRVGHLIRVINWAFEPPVHIMRLSPHPYIRLSSVILLVPSLATAISLDCSDVRDDGVSFNFRTLEGPHSLYRIEKQPNGIKTTTFTIDICRPLEKQKGVPKEEDCPNYSRGRLISWRKWPLCCTLHKLTFTFPLQPVPSSAWTIRLKM